MHTNDAASRIATTMPRKEDSVSHMAQRGSLAASTGVPTESLGEEFVSHMAQKLTRRNDAASRDVTSKSKREEFVRGIVWKVEMMQPRRMYEGGEEESEER